MTQNNWKILPKPNPKVVDELASRLDISRLTATIVAQKGYTDAESAYQYLSPSIEQLHDPMLLHDMDKAVERLQEAAFGGEKIVIYGDYDLDGLTSTAVMYEALAILGADVSYYIPNRFNDGYGPNKAVYQKLIQDGAQLIVTVDNGVTGYDAVNCAKALGVDVIITDHHELAPTLPEAYAIVHPRHPEGHYPFNDLSGVGVAFKVAQALLSDGEAITDISQLPTEMLDLVAMGEIADMVSLTDENRVLVSLGLKQMNDSPRPGIQYLLKNAGQAKNQPVISETVSFKIAPRLNAVGRMGDASLGLDLLLSQDLDESKALAKEVEAINKQRQEVVEKVFSEAKSLALSPQYQNDKILLLSGENWHEGILGIVASRIVELTKKPTIILSQKDDILKGSGRSYGAFDLYQFMALFRDTYTTFGGHASAIGLSLSVTSLAALREKIKAKNSTITLVTKPIEVNLLLPSDTINNSTYESLTLLEPFGTDNQRPVFVFEEPKIMNATTMGNLKQHVKLSLANLQSDVEAVGFNHPDWVPVVTQSTNISFVATIGTNYFRGRQTLQLMMLDVKHVTSNDDVTVKQRFAMTYKYIMQHQSLNFAHHLPDVASQLGASVSDLKVVVQVFLELGFVKIDNGFVKIIENAPQKALSQSTTYLRYFNKVK